jgi:hypothetical protein
MIKSTIPRLARLVRGTRPCSTPLATTTSTTTTHTTYCRTYGSGPSSPNNIQTTPLWSPGLIFDPYIPDPPEGVPSIFTVAGIRIRIRQMNLNLKSGFASARIRKTFSDFSPLEVGDMAEDMFRQVHRAYEEENRKAIQHHVTEALYPDLKRGLSKNWALVNTDTVPLRLVGMAERPNIVQMRVLNTDKENKEKTFAQLTVRVNGEYVDANEGVVSGEEEKGTGQQRESSTTKKRRGKNQGKKNVVKKYVLPPQDGRHARGEWRSSVDEAGKVYYYHTKTKETTWNEPAEFVTSSSSLGIASVDDESADASQDKSTKLYRSKKYIVLERDLYLGDQGRWRICKLD